MPKNAEIFTCEKCNFVCSKKSNYDKHIMTRKHNLKQLKHEKMPKNALPYFKCDFCTQQFKSRTSMWRHKKMCDHAPFGEIDDEDGIMNVEATVADTGSGGGKVFSEMKDMVFTLVSQNKDMQTLIHDQNKTIIELSKNNSNGGNNMSHSHNHTNSHNKTFNMQFFLNETCKDAMNITDFVNSLKLSLGDLEKVGELGYAEGISRMFVRGLNDLEVTKRPIHCSDSKREVLHIKDQDKWEKDTVNQDKLKKAIKDLSNKNIMLLDDWRDQNPGCTDYDNRKNSLYLKMMVESMGPATDVTERKDFGRIIKTIANNTIIDKDLMKS